MLAATVGAGEERILSVQRDWADATLHHIGIGLDAAASRKRVMLPKRDSEWRIALASLVF